MSASRSDVCQWEKGEEELSRILVKLKNMSKEF